MCLGTSIMNVLVIAKTLVPPICFAADLSRLRRSRVPNWGLSWNFGTGKLGQLGLVMVTIPKRHQRLSILYDIYCLMLCGDRGGACSAKSEIPFSVGRIF